MAASKKKRTGARAAVVVVLCLVLVCVVAAAVALGLVSRRVKSFAGGASFSLDYQITSTAAEEPALYKVLAQFGGTSGRVDGQYTPEALQLELYPQASGPSPACTSARTRRCTMPGSFTAPCAAASPTTIRWPVC